MKKLFIPFILLLISAILMSSATYAWFSMNQTVAAVGMQITAEVPTQLLIKGSAAGAEYKSEIDFSNNNDSAVYSAVALEHLYPVAYKSRSAATSNPNSTFKKLATTTYTRVDIDGKVDGAPADLTTADYVAATAGTDYVRDTFTLKYAGDFSTSLDNCALVLTLTEEADKVSNIRGAIHLVLVDDKSTPNVYEYDFSSATGTPVAGSATEYTLSAGNVTAFTAANEEITYTAYLFFDGEDSDCKNSNAVNMDAYSLHFSFTLVD